MMSLILQTGLLDGLARSSAMVGLLAVAGLIAGCAGFLVMIATRERSFALRASLLQGCTVLLLAVSIVPMIPRGVLPSAPRALASTRELAPFRVVRQVTVIADRAVLTNNSRSVIRTTTALLFVVWMVGAIAFLSRLIRGAVLISAIRKRARPTTRARVLVSDEIDIPCAAGLFNSVVIVPRESECWSTDEWNSVLAHERAHIERNDVLMHWVRQFVLAIHWFNPAVHWLDRVSHEACEGACDDAAVIAGADPHTYASALITFASGMSRDIPVQAAALIGRSGIAQRVAALVDARRARRLSRRSDNLLPLLAGIAGGFGVLVVAPVPTAFALASPIIVAAQTIAPAVPIDTARPKAKHQTPRKAATEVVTTADDNVEAIAGLAALLSDPNPILRQSAVDAMRSWGEQGRTILRSLANGPDAGRAESARAALTVVGDSR